MSSKLEKASSLLIHLPAGFQAVVVPHVRSVGDAWLITCEPTSFPRLSTACQLINALRHNERVSRFEWLTAHGQLLYFIGQAVGLEPRHQAHDAQSLR